MRTAKDDWRDTLSRLRHERDRFAKLSAEQRREVAALRKKGRWLEVIEAMDRMFEFKRTSEQFAEEIRKIRQMGYQ